MVDFPAQTQKLPPILRLGCLVGVVLLFAVMTPACVQRIEAGHRRQFGERCAPALFRRLDHVRGESLRIDLVDHRTARLDRHDPGDAKLARLFDHPVDAALLDRCGDQPEVGDGFARRQTFGDPQREVKQLHSLVAQRARVIVIAGSGYVDGEQFPSTFGTGTGSIYVPADPQLLGVTLTVQAAALSLDNALGVVTSNGLTTTIGS